MDANSIENNDQKDGLSFLEVNIIEEDVELKITDDKVAPSRRRLEKSEYFNSASQKISRSSVKASVLRPILPRPKNTVVATDKSRLLSLSQLKKLPSTAESFDALVRAGHIVKNVQGNIDGLKIRSPMATVSITPDNLENSNMATQKRVSNTEGGMSLSSPGLAKLRRLTEISVKTPEKGAKQNSNEKSTEEVNEIETFESNLEDRTQGLQLRNIVEISLKKSLSGIKNAFEISTDVNVAIEDWPGEFEFNLDRQSLSMTSEKEKANDATYSNILDKLYTDMNKCFWIRFSLGNAPEGLDYSDVLLRYVQGPHEVAGQAFF